MPGPPPPYRAAPPGSPARRAPRHKASRFNTKTILVVGVALSLMLVGACMLTLLAGVGLVYGSGRVLPGVSSVGIDLGNMSEDSAAQALADVWANNGLLLRDGSRTWAVSSAELGVTLDAAATAAAAREWGRSRGGLSGALRSVTGGVNVEPVLNVDLVRLGVYLETARSFADLPAQNAGVRLVNGQATATPASNGSELDIPATVEKMRLDAAGELADGALDLVMHATFPALADASPLVGQANALLASFFTVRAYDPIRDEWTNWPVSPEVWAEWLTAQASPDSPTGLALAMNTAGPTAFLQASSVFPDERYIKIDEAVAAMQQAVAQSQTGATIRVWHNPTVYTVHAGQTLAAIAEEVGIPYPYIQAENPGINADALVVGQELTLPSKDVLVPLNPVPSKRILISRSQQHMWAYENGQVVFDWVISTGIASSPTAIGVFQVQSHELNAYADQWNLYMPHFIGFYHPGPNVDVMNGFHGFPTRGGGYLLWTDSLGGPATYGCVLLSLENAETLFNWAEAGVVVEVQA